MAEIINFRLRDARSVDDLIGQARLVLVQEGVHQDKIEFVAQELKHHWSRVLDAGDGEGDRAADAIISAAMFQIVKLCLDLYDARKGR